MEEKYKNGVDVAVRSSATAEDLPGASFAGQQETFLNVVGEEELILSVKKATSSLFTDRAISYRQDKGFSHENVALSVGVQKMVRSDLGSSGVAFSIDTETGFDKVVVIDSSYGLGDMVVQGRVAPDEFIVFKPSLETGKSAILERSLGKKEKKEIYGGEGVKVVETEKEERESYSLLDEDVEKLAKWVVKIEKHFSEKYGKEQPMDVEWAKDGETGELFIIQARPETVHSTKEKDVYEEYKLKGKGEKLVEGIAVGMKIASGKVNVIKNASEISKFKEGEILVTEITDPDWEPIMKIASGIITNKGGRTSHAAIVSRELGVPAIVGAEDATKRLKKESMVTIDSSSGKKGFVYKGELEYKTVKRRLDDIPQTKTKVMVNVGSPHEALKNHYLPVSGVGLGRVEFIATSHIGIHPNALLNYEKIKEENRNKKMIAQIDEITKGYKDKALFYKDKLTEGISQIAAAFWPNKVIIRFSDFKTNEYKTFLGGEEYEPEEENPMLGWRGASRYYHPDFKDAFGLECKAVKRVREELGFTNVSLLIPFCRTPDEGKKVIKVMKENGLDREKCEDLKIYIMAEIPSNKELADEFLKTFDGMSIGSNDLTQLVLGMDRDSAIVQKITDERNRAVKKVVSEIINSCKNNEKYIGICGQAPSDFPEFAKFLVNEGIDSISLNSDAVIKTLSVIKEAEDEM